VLIGLDAVAGWFDGEALEAWRAEHGGLGSYPVVDWREAERAVREDGALLLDVRNQTEWNEGHVPGARHVHLGYLRGRVDELPRDRPILLYCRSGHRSGIGVSVLRAAGFRDVANVEGGLEARHGAGLPVG